MFNSLLLGMGRANRQVRLDTFKWMVLARSLVIASMLRWCVRPWQVRDAGDGISSDKICHGDHARVIEPLKPRSRLSQLLRTNAGLGCWCMGKRKPYGGHIKSTTVLVASEFLKNKTLTPAVKEASRQALTFYDEKHHLLWYLLNTIRIKYDVIKRQINQLVISQPDFTVCSNYEFFFRPPAHVFFFPTSSYFLFAAYKWRKKYYYGFISVLVL